MTTPRIGVLTNGGDCPGLNAGIVAARATIIDAGGDCVLLRDGYASLVATGHGDDPELHTIDARTIDWRRCGRWGGSVLGSSRTNLGRDELYAHAMVGIDRLRLDGLVIFGGDGTLTSAARLGADGIPVGAAPKTIDNDVAASDLSLGFTTAVHSAVDALDRLADTAITHRRGFLVEVMGRRTGQLAAAVATSGLADGVCVPEAPWHLTQLTDRFTATDSALIVISESAWPVELGTAGSGRVGGCATATAAALTPLGTTAAAVTLGHVLRGGTPVPADRLLGRQLGTLAAVAALTGGGLAAVRGGQAALVDIADAAAGRRALTPDELDQLGPLLIRH
jgi:ATP-dependent phosphofructokinase / diphosphate-dependent phosphofructokinase